MIVIRAELVGGTYHASDHTLRRPEWPPHPDRVFQALVAANHGVGNPEQGRRVLQIIESAQWDVHASESLPRPEMLQYVPRNEDPGGGTGSYPTVHLTARMKERRLPVTTPISPVVHYYIHADVPAADLTHLAENVARLGRSPVAMSVTQQAPQANWLRLQTSGELRLRVPYKGRLDDLEKAFESGRRASFKWGSYGHMDTIADANIPRGEFREIVILAASGSGVDGTRLAPLIEAARKSVLSLCSDPLPSWISGHRPDGDRLTDSHLAIIPTPFTGKRGDGRVMGIGLAIPGIVPVEESRACLQPVFDRGLTLADQEWSLKNCRSLSTEPATWTCPSRLWVSVSPVEIRRRDQRSATEIAAEWAERSLLPAPVNAQMRSQPFIHGPAHAANYAPGKRPRLRMHFRIEWSEPVLGPIAIGMGRYRGFGMMRPVDNEF